MFSRLQNTLQLSSNLMTSAIQWSFQHKKVLAVLALLNLASSATAQRIFLQYSCGFFEQQRVSTGDNCFDVSLTGAAPGSSFYCQVTQAFVNSASHPGSGNHLFKQVPGTQQEEIFCRNAQEHLGIIIEADQNDYSAFNNRM